MEIISCGEGDGKGCMNDYGWGHGDGFGEGSGEGYCNIHGTGFGGDTICLQNGSGDIDGSGDGYNMEVIIKNKIINTYGNYS